MLHVASNITRLYGILKASRSARRESSSCSSERITRVARQTSLHDSLIVYDIIFNNKRRRYLEGEIIRYTLEKEIIQKSKGFEIRGGFSTRRERRERISKSFGSDLRARRWILKRLRRSRWILKIAASAAFPFKFTRIHLGEGALFRVCASLSRGSRWIREFLFTRVHARDDDDARAFPPMVSFVNRVSHLPKLYSLFVASKKWRDFAETIHWFCRQFYTPLHYVARNFEIEIELVFSHEVKKKLKKRV